MPERPLRVAVAQSLSVPGDVVANVRAATRTIADARDDGADLVVFPELSLTGYELGALASSSEPWLTSDDARLVPLRRACADARVTAVVGAPLLGAENRPRLAALVIDAAGELGVTCKQHLHGAEGTLFEAEKPRAPFDVGGWRVAVAICFDAAHPRHAEAAAAQGADLYLVSAFYGVGDERRADLHLAARAMDHRMFSALANHAGTTGGYVSCGGSGVWGPTGDPLRRASSSAETLLVAELDPAELAAFRNG